MQGGVQHEQRSTTRGAQQHQTWGAAHCAVAPSPISSALCKQGACPQHSQPSPSPLSTTRRPETPEAHAHTCLEPHGTTAAPSPLQHPRTGRPGRPGRLWPGRCQTSCCCRRATCGGAPASARARVQFMRMCVCAVHAQGKVANLPARAHMNSCTSACVHGFRTRTGEGGQPAGMCQCHCAAGWRNGGVQSGRHLVADKRTQVQSPHFRERTRRVPRTQGHLTHSLTHLPHSLPDSLPLTSSLIHLPHSLPDSLPLTSSLTCLPHSHTHARAPFASLTHAAGAASMQVCSCTRAQPPTTMRLRAL